LYVAPNPEEEAPEAKLIVCPDAPTVIVVALV
jgi:hypothetical protein